MSIILAQVQGAALSGLPKGTAAFHKRKDRKRLSFLLSCLAALLISGMEPALAGGPPAMTVPGQPGVSQTGAFTYTIPIAVPPGSAGVKPSLSLNYSSHGTDGYMGLGWSLGGLSSITHCPRTIAEDSVHGGVNYDTNDRYCLDGQRLILISGTYGADSSQYRTEIEGFREIIAHGSAGNGPAWFEVHLRTGQVLQYGDTTSSQILAVGSTTARAWALNQFTDTKGNYYTVTYTNDATNGQFYPSQINYTGNTSASLTPYNSVQFSYATRGDIVPTYQAGSLQQTTVLLTDVKTYNGTTLVFDYKLAYTAASSNASHDELASVTQCDASSNCLAPTTFGWQGSRDNPSMSTVAEPSYTSGYAVAPGDFNGDGLTDFLIQAAYPNCWSGGNVFFGSNSGTFTSGGMTANYDTYETDSTTIVPYSGGACFQCADSVPADINGDGITDLAVHVTAYEYIVILGVGSWFAVPTSETVTSNGSAFTQVSTAGALGYPFILTRAYDNFPSDFNGDGLADGWGAVISGIGYADIGNGSGIFTPDSGHSGFPSTATTFLSGDFDGDGCTDILAQGGGTGAIVYFCQPAVTSTTVPDWSPSQTVLGDFNGDGKTDVLVATSSGAKLYLSTGTGFAAPISIPGSSTWYEYTIVAGDWNGDGKTDIALISQTSGTPHLIYLSTGTGFEELTSISNTDTYAAAVVADWNNDGASDIWMLDPSNPNEYLFAYVPELMTTVNNGVGATTTVAYDRLNHATVYTKGTGATYPTQDVDNAAYVVSQMSVSNGIGGNYSTTYAYSGLKKDLSGRGELGFSQVAVTDSQTGIVRTTNYRTDFPYIGLASSQTVTSGSTTLKQVTNTFTSTNLGGSGPGAAYYFVSLQQSVVSGADLSGTAFPTTTTSYTYDSYGNPLTKTVSVSDGSSRVTTNTYNNNTTSWFIGQLLTSQTQSIVGSSNLTRHWSFSYDPTSGLPTQGVIEPSTSSLKLTEAIGYDSYGNMNDITISGSGITTRSVGATYDSLGEYPITTTNALSQSDQWTYNAAFGETLTHTDPNTIESSVSYDTFGRPILATRPDGNKTSISYLYCSGVDGGSASCPTYGAYLAQATPENSSGGQNGAIAITYYDALGRVIATETQGFDGSWIEVSTQYDSNGRVSETSRPYFVSGGTPAWTVYTHDALGRVTKATFPDTSATTYGYNALTTTVTNAESETTTTVKNAQGLVASVTDANSKTTSYIYDAFGNPLTITDPSGNVISNTFDLRGRKTAMSDPDMGSWSYAYNVLSQLTSQTSPNEVANSQPATTLTYDLMGRPLKRTEPDLTSEWTYDAETDGIGQLAHTCNADPCSDANYETTQLYDTYGRISSEKLKRSGTNFTYTLSYNSDGRLATLEYPSGFTAKYVYTSLGYLSQIVDNSTGTAYWTANTRDAELHLLQATAGNGVVTNQNFDSNTGRLLAICATPDSGSCDGYTANFSYVWDPIGRLTSRADTIEGYTENFCYDSLNRLTNYALGSSCTASGTTTVGYDALGDIASKSDVGTYSYPTSGSGSVQPHAVSSITGTVNGVTNPTFTYDANGNMTAGDGRAITYTSYNMPATVTEGTTTSAFVYSTAHARMQQCVPNCTSPTTTTYYINDPATGSMEEEVVSGSTTTWHDFIIADGDIVAELFKTGSTTTPVYFNGDHLGSTSVLTNSSGAVTERDSYDAWGRRRNPNGTESSTCTITSQTTRGYTDQEMMDPVCLVNLNARLYDPTIGRIMSADPTVPYPLRGQSFNRYSYVENRPLSAIDPSGYDDGTPDPGPANSNIVPVDGTNSPTTAGSYTLPDGSTYTGAETGSNISGDNGDPVYDGGILAVGGGIMGNVPGGFGGGGGGGGFAADYGAMLPAIGTNGTGGYIQVGPMSSQDDTSGPIEQVTLTCDCQWVSGTNGGFGFGNCFMSCGSTTVDLRFREVILGGVDTGAMHGFIVVKNNLTGKQWVSQGGPDYSVPCAYCLVPLPSDQSWTEPYTSSNTGYGQPYVSVSSYTTSMSTDLIVDQLTQFSNQFNSEELPYLYPTPNSNFYAGEAWQNLTGSIPALPSNVNAPGWPGP
jgi:RHS repeat-associated protein